MDALTTSIQSAEADLASIEAAMKLNADRYARLCERYLEATKLLRELRAIANQELAQGLHANAVQARRP